jgi:multiple sugar transport system permease protein
MEVSATRARSREWRGLGRRATAVLVNVFTTVLAVMFLFPFVWSASCSLKTGPEVVAFPPRLLPKVIQWRNFHLAWTATDFEVFFRNSTIVTVLGIIGQMASSILVAYGFARFDFPGRNALFLLCLSGMMMPVYVTIIPLFTLFRALWWTDTLKPLIVPCYFGSAFAIFLLRQFIMTIPLELDESALIDGAGTLTILTRIILPNTTPALAAVALFAFRAIWDDFLGPMIFVDNIKNFTLTMGLWFLKFQSWDQTSGPQDHLLMAGAMMTTLPVVVVFVAAQSYFIEGIVTSGIKG